VGPLIGGSLLANQWTPQQLFWPQPSRVRFEIVMLGCALFEERSRLVGTASRRAPLAH
jgi:hypothetical protein